MVTKKESAENNWVDRGTEFAGECKKLCEAEEIPIYSTTTEIDAAFVGHTIRSLKNLLYRYIEDNGIKYIHKLTQISDNCELQKKLLDRFDTEKCQEFPFSVHSVQPATTRISIT